MNDSKKNLKEVALLFFKMGCVAFGGPAAHIAMMQEEVVTKRKWFTQEHFLDLISLTSIIPGPNSTEMTMHCGHQRAGRAGLVVGGLSFIFPAIVITGLLAYFYVTYGSLPAVEPFLVGIKPIVLAIIASAILKLGKKALKSAELYVLGAFTIFLCVMGIAEVFSLLLTGGIGVLYYTLKNKGAAPSVWPIGLLTVGTTLFNKAIFLSFLKVGAILYGSGYVLFAYLDSELVETGILSTQQLLDAIAVGQFTPGPVLSTATFIGYQLDGLGGALAASAGIFLPSFVFVLILSPFIPKIRNSKYIRYFLDAVNVAAVAVMLYVLIKMGLETLTDWKPLLVGAVGFGLVFILKWNKPMFLVLIGSALGWVLSLV